MSRIQVVGLFTYPVKGMQGVSHRGAVNVNARGLNLDRRFMLVDPSGRFITQRECPELASHWVLIEGGGRPYLKIHCERWASLVQMPGVFRWEEGERISVTVWDDTVEAIVQDDEANQFLSRSLGRPVRLVYIPDSTVRPSRKQRADTEQVLNGFADGFPFLLTSEESLAALNAKIDSEMKIGMDRFRPNIVVRGCTDAFEEESWRVFRIGDVTFYGMKRCARCIVTTTDQKTGVRMGKEPLKALAAHRRFGNDVCFGMNLNHANTGSIHVGDEVEIIERGKPFFANRKMSI